MLKFAYDVVQAIPYPKQEKTASMSKDVTDLTKLKISDLTADEEE